MEKVETSKKKNTMPYSCSEYATQNMGGSEF